MHKFLTAAALAALLVPAAALADAPPRAGQIAPAFNGPVVAGGKGAFDSKSLRGKAFYLNFFASWCQPCKMELPYIGRLARQYAKRGVVTIGVDELEPVEQAAAFANSFHLPYRIVLDRNGDIGGNYGVNGMPVHVFVDARGNVALYRVGPIPEADLRAELDKLSRR